MSEMQGRTFASFKTVWDFIAFYHDIPDDEKMFHEVVQGTATQKLRFDIDMHIPSPNGITSDQVAISLIQETEKYFKEKLSIDINRFMEILVFSSHGKEKMSNHIILNGYCFKGNEAVKKIAEDITARIPIEQREFVDLSIYKSLQNFRIVYSRKADGRVKIPQFFFLPREAFSEKDRFSMILSASLITECSSCRLVAVPGVSEEVHRSKRVIEVDDLKVNEAITLITASYFNGAFPYVYNGVVNGFVQLKRIASCYCPLCERSHEADNAFMRVDENSASFFCYRTKGRKIVVQLNDETPAKEKPPVGVPSESLKKEGGNLSLLLSIVYPEKEEVRTEDVPSCFFSGLLHDLSKSVT